MPLRWRPPALRCATQLHVLPGCWSNPKAFPPPNFPLSLNNGWPPLASNWPCSVTTWPVVSVITDRQVAVVVPQAGSAQSASLTATPKLARARRARVARIYRSAG